ncbi:MAG TPA: type II secretion system F family protein [Candidatus Norongarragalinales archaeon]|jgi:flagellar protein FlaJ|nr:type II secretion system F family protein [Candidatus Norongarragalinales archaeon]
MTDENEGRSASSEEIEKIIARLKQKQGQKIEKAAPKQEAVLKAVEASAFEKEQPLSFARVAPTLQSSKGFFGFVGGLYSVLGGLLSGAAKFLFRFPAARGLRKDLESADISIPLEAYLVVSGAFGLLAGIMVFVAAAAYGYLAGDLLVLGVSPLLGLIVALMVSLFMIIRPGMTASGRAAEVDKELPFALRQMSTQLKAGVSFHKSMASIANAGYGVLSEEFRKVMRDLERGSSTEEALLRLATRTRSKGLKKTLVQILRAIRTGGNLSEIITGIADDIAFETRSKIRDFTEQLNIISIFYIMASVVVPVMLTVVSAVLQLPVLGGGLPFGVILFLFFGISLVMIGILALIHRLEPTA